MMDATIVLANESGDWVVDSFCGRHLGDAGLYGACMEMADGSCASVNLPCSTWRSANTSCAISFSFAFSFLFFVYNFPGTCFCKFGDFSLPSALVGGDILDQVPAPGPAPFC